MIVASLSIFAILAWLVGGVITYTVLHRAGLKAYKNNWQREWGRPCPPSLEKYSADDLEGFKAMLWPITMPIMAISLSVNKYLDEKEVRQKELEKRLEELEEELRKGR